MIQRMLILCSLLSIGLVGFTQDKGYFVVPDFKGEVESFFSVKDSVLRSEIGSFTFTGSLLGMTGRAPLFEFGLLAQSNNNLTLYHEEIKVHFGASSFDPFYHRLEYHGSGGYLYKINGRSFWGIDGRIPEMKLEILRVFFGNQIFEIPRSAYQDIYEPNFCRRSRFFGPVECASRAFLSVDRKRLYIYMRNGRIPSLYEVTWIISEGRYVGRVVDYAY